MERVRRYLPILDWGRDYSRATAAEDLIAAAIVTVMLIPQSLAYALVAGLPPEVGLYASILPLVAYGILGSSRVLAVGPVAVASLMTATAASRVAAQGTSEYYAAAIALAAISGLILIVMGLLRLGFLANLLSHPVISGFVAASGILIAASQIKSILGVRADGDTLIEILRELIPQLPQTNTPTAIIGLSTIGALFWVRKALKPLLLARGVSARAADIAARIAPMLAIAIATAVTAGLRLDQRGVEVVGDVPAGLPTVAIPAFTPELWRQLLIPALLISVVGFVESISVGQTLAARRRQRIVPDQELIALGASNAASAVSGGFPVTGGFSRSVVNFDAGARTPAAGVFTAIGIALTTVFLTPAVHYLPKASLGATIIVAVLSIIDLGAIRRVARYSPSDFTSIVITVVLTLTTGVEIGIAAGVVSAVLAHLFRASRPHVAIVGLVPGTHYFRNVARHEVLTAPDVLSIRIDSSLYFPNARFLEETVADLLAERPAVKHVVLVCTAVNVIDASALESLEAINERLRSAGVQFHLSAVKGPVLDRLRRSDFPHELTGQIFENHYEAYSALAPEVVQAGVGRAQLRDDDSPR